MKAKRVITLLILCYFIKTAEQILYFLGDEDIFQLVFDELISFDDFELSELMRWVFNILFNILHIMFFHKVYSGIVEASRRNLRSDKMEKMQNNVKKSSTETGSVEQEVVNGGVA